MKLIILVFLLFLVCFLAIIFVLEYRNTQKRLQLVKATQPSSIARLREGLVALKAKLFSTKLQFSPVRQIDCAWYSLEIEKEFRRRREVKSRWSTVFTESKSEACFLDDLTGTCRVDLANIEFEFQGEHIKLFATTANPTPEEVALLQQCHVDTTKIDAHSSIRYTEYTLCAGDDVYLLGNCTTDPATGEKILQGNKKIPLFLSDLSGDALVQKLENKLTETRLALGFLLVLGTVLSLALWNA